MTTSEEVLQTMAEIPESAPVCVIDPETRTIIVPPEYQLFGVENDKRTERLYFQCPKIVGDNQDLSQNYQLFMNYQNANGDPDAYHIEDMEVDGDNITFSWLLEENVTKYRGNIQFAFGAIIPGDDAEDPDKNRWNTTINTDCTCLVGLKCTQQVAESNPDALVQIWAAIDELKAGGGGGTGGTTNYENLSNKPQLNGVTLEGNKTLDQVGVLAKNQGASNSGKFLSVGSDGNVVPADAPSGGTVDPEQIKQAVNGYLEENPVSGMTAEQEQQLNQNTTDVADLKSAMPKVDTTLSNTGEAADAKVTGDAISSLSEDINNMWSDVIIGELFENDEIIEPELPYKKDGLDTYINFTYYPDGFPGKFGDLSENNTEVVTAGTDLYTSGRNGMVGGKFMVNGGPLNNVAGSRMAIESEAIHAYPFSVEMCVHLRRDYNPYAGNGVLNYTSTDALQNYQATLFSTQYNSSDGTGTTNGVKVMINKENVSISGSTNTPNVSKNVPGLEIDGIQNENIGDRYDHIVVCFDSNKQKFYLNNELIIDSDEKSVSLTMSSVLKILPDLLKGDIKLIRIYEGMLSDDDVAMNYSNAVGGIENEI